MPEQPRMTVVDDATPLGGASIDVAARIAWTLRMARTTSGAPDSRMRSLASSLGTSTARLSRAETGQLRDGSLVDGYEQVLGLPEGSLRAPIDVLARTFPSASPPDVRPGEVITSVAELSELTERLDSGTTATGGDWLRWTRAIAAPGNIGMPVPLAQRVVGRLVRELARSCGHGYPSRYEALAKLRCSDYGFLVLRAAQHEVAHPHAQGLADLLSAVGEAVTPDGVEWCLELLRSDQAHLALCGALALENMGEISPAGTFWPGVLPGLVTAFDRSEPGSSQEEWAAHLVRLVPPATWRSSTTKPGRSLPPAPEVEGFDRHRANRQWQQCAAIASDVGHEVGVGDQPMLARLVFDIGYGHWETRGVTGYLLLAGLPALAAPVWDRFRTLVDAEPDQRIRHRMARRLHGALAGRAIPGIAEWLDSPDPVLRSAALQVLGSAGQVLPLDDVRTALADPGTVRAATYAVGMSGHPALPRIARDRTLDAHVRGSLAWWLERGSRLTV
ncbi:HEAT repeat domain-containing protein [Nocardioides oleivorans]|uniref:HEAT repeat domain-containing protein n=1 Tax=Nocardioides oleivorans TaxID=273676 RepID=A0A4Q2RWQ5_9ACTN|nr:HEAT repeat domain-containing protein [Nocardioides oleivorans]RYB93428.1 HEAT repeat domain-containing protein [Nocardioides oleivorans]